MTDWRRLRRHAPSSLVVLAAALPISSARGQGPAPVVGRPVLISADAPGARHVETVLAVSPRDPRVLVGAAIRVGDTSHTVVYASGDGGRTWAPGRDARGRALADTTDDPALAFDPRGRVYFTARAAALRVRRSLDGGRTWDDGAAVPGLGPDRPWLAVAPAGDRLFAIAKQEVVLGDEQGELFVATSAAARLGADSVPLRFTGPRLFLPAAPGGAVLLVVSSVLPLADSLAVAAATECRVPPPTASSVSGGPAPGSGPPAGGSRGAGLLRCRRYALVSYNGGRRFGAAHTIAEMVAHTNDALALAVKGAGGGQLAADGSARPTRGRLYLTWPDWRGGRYVPVVAASADTGRTWSAPVAVNDDRTTANHSNPGVAVNAAGAVGVVWNDRRADAADDCFRPTFAASMDGGRTFGPNVPLTAAAACTAAPGARPAFDRFANGGDTFGIAAAPDGAFHILYVAPAPGGDRRAWQLWATRVTVPSAR